MNAPRLALAALALTSAILVAGRPVEAFEPAMEEAYQGSLRPFTGESVPGVDRSTLAGKVVTGYQGWFRAEGDGSGLGWVHYGGHDFGPGACTIDLWPDVRELPAGDRFPTAFRHADGSMAEVFSSVKPGTVRLHFEWMREHGIDAAFVQRFATTARDRRHLPALNQVLLNARDAANATGRAYVVMYDLSGLKPEHFDLVIEDWRRLVHLGGLSKDPKDAAYLRHRGKPLVALWGLGFNDRPAAFHEWEKLLRYFREDGENPGAGGGSGCTVMVGVPTYWRERIRDSVEDARLHDLIGLAHIVSPWTVGRYGHEKDAAKHGEKTWTPDAAWCRERGLELLPVAFPGFSWHNLQKKRGQEGKLNAIPREGGRFLWSQGVAARRAGAGALYVAMFDEVDEGTAIFKCRNDPPVGASPFLSYEGLPEDHYLWLTGQMGRLMRGEIGSETMPERE